MRLTALFFSMMFALGVFADPSPVSTNALLPAARYDLAEFIFRECMSPDAKCVYHLSYNTNASVLPADFMARFAKQPRVVQSVPDGFTTVSNKFVVDKITHGEAVALAILELRVIGESAEVLMLRFASFTSNRTRYFLVREHGKWRVRDRKVEAIACG